MRLLGLIEGGSRLLETDCKKLIAADDDEGDCCCKEGARDVVVLADAVHGVKGACRMEGHRPRPRLQTLPVQRLQLPNLPAPRTPLATSV